MNLFIKNQLKALSIIKTNINNYIELFEKMKDTLVLSDTIKNSTDEINSELEHQRCTLIFINIINWSIPIGLIAYICTYIHFFIKEISF